MLARLRQLAERIRSSLWFVPAWMSLAAALVALAAATADERLAAEGIELSLLYPGDRQGARSLLSTVAGSMITVAGVVFSVTVVALSMASAQFGPRLLLNFMRDRGNQLVLGTFISTFLYCLLALARGMHRPTVVPAVTASVGLLLAITSVVVLIFFIHHVSSSIRAERVVDEVSRELDHAMERLFPLSHGDSAVPAPEALTELEGGKEVHALRDGYVRGIGEERLVALAAADDRVIRALRRPGQFVVEGAPILRVSGSRSLSDADAAELAECFVIGRERSFAEDAEYGIHQLVEVALRALSPGVNDPFTAISCVDWLGAALCKVGRRPLRPPGRVDREGRLRLVVEPVTFEGMLAAAFTQIRQASRSIPAVSIRVLEMLAEIGRSVGEDVRRDAVRAHADHVLKGALADAVDDSDRRDLQARHRAVMVALGLDVPVESSD